MNVFISAKQWFFFIVINCSIINIILIILKELVLFWMMEFYIFQRVGFI